MYPTKHTLYDDFTIKGKFWLPPAKRRKPKKIDGTLRVSAGKRILLELFGDFVSLADRTGSIGDGGKAGRPPLIYGENSSGQPITLFDSFWSRRNFGSAGHVRSEYTSNKCIIGAWFEGDDDIRFHRLELMLTHLEPWLGVSPFRSEAVMDGEQQVGTQVTYTYHDEITVEIPEPKLIFKFVPHLFPDSEPNYFVKLNHETAVELTPAEPLSWESAYRIMADVQMLFTLMVGEQVFVRKLRGSIMAKDYSRVTKAGRKLYDVPCDVFFNQFDLREAPNLMQDRMTMPYGHMAEMFPTVLLNWFASLPKLGPVYNVFFATYRASRMFTESHFLHRSQALESYDRRTNGGQYLTNEEYDGVYKAMAAAIPAKVPSGLREKMKRGTLKYANEFSLRKRMTDLVNSLSVEEQKLICVNVGEFAGAVVDMRNDLTHVLGEPKAEDKTRSVKIRQLGHASKKLELLMIILLMKSLGLPSELVLQRVKACQRFDLEPFKATK